MSNRNDNLRDAFETIRLQMGELFNRLGDVERTLHEHHYRIDALEHPDPSVGVYPIHGVAYTAEVMTALDELVAVMARQLQPPGDEGSDE